MWWCWRGGWPISGPPTATPWSGLPSTTRGGSALLNVLLAVNVLCAALIRIPWKRHQTGFVITHAGILTLMFGAYLSRCEGIDALLRVAEGHAAAQAQNDRQYLLLTVRPSGESTSADRADDDTEAKGRAGGAAGSEIETVRISFAGGPFNWDDYARMPWLPWAFGRRNVGVLWDRDGVRLETLDYYSDFRPVPQLKIRVAVGSERGGGPVATQGELFTLTVSDLLLGRQMPPGPYGFGDQADLDSGQHIAFWLTGDEAQTAAFADAAPGAAGAGGASGAARAGAKVRRAAGPADQGNAGTQPGADGLDGGLQRLRAAAQGGALTVSGGTEPEEQMVLLGSRPDYNRQAWRHQVFGDFWLAADDKGRPDGPRIDVIQGGDRRLHVRAWRAGKLASLGLLDAGGRPLPVWPARPTP